METYLILILTVIVAILVWQSIIAFLRQRDNRNRQIILNQLISHIYNQIKNTGKIDLILDGKKITVIEEIKKNKK